MDKLPRRLIRPTAGDGGIFGSTPGGCRGCRRSRRAPVASQLLEDLDAWRGLGESTEPRQFQGVQRAIPTGRRSPGQRVSARHRKVECPQRRWDEAHSRCFCVPHRQMQPLQLRNKSVRMTALSRGVLVACATPSTMAKRSRPQGVTFPPDNRLEQAWRQYSKPLPISSLRRGPGQISER